MRIIASLTFTASILAFWIHGIATLNQTHPGWAGGITLLTITAGAIVAATRNE
jgi:hypothetical protein